MTIDLAVLFSGGGRTILNILDHIERGDLDANISLAIASRSHIAGIQRLTERGIEVVIAKKPDETHATGDNHVQDWLNKSRPDLICLCGYLRLLSIEPWMEGRILNIHPALLPKYGGKGMFGMNVHKAVIQNSEAESGCTVHYVDEEYDHGPTILQRTCTIHEGELPKSLADRVFLLECEAYPTAIKLVAEELKV